MDSSPDADSRRSTDATVRIESLVRSLLDERNPTFSLRPEVLELLQHLGRLTGYVRPADEPLDVGETATTQGLAISPGHAVICGEDVARTVVFLRGVSAALDAATRAKPGAVEVLYAGCGPYALLLVPLLAARSDVAVRATLIDIHSESIERVRHLLRMLDLENAAVRLEVADAADYRIAADRRPDLIVAEVMQAALGKEPQVAVTRNLVQQAPDALLVPEQVRIDVVLVDLSKEFDLSGDGSGPERDRIELGTAFRLDRDRALAWAGEKGPVLEGPVLEVPAWPGGRYDAMLFTRIRAFGDHRLEAYDSGLTSPRPLALDRWPVAGEGLRFRYRLGARPELQAGIVRATPPPA
ncbi:hypothetical protein [Halomonas denitrificans]|nr:hypothetical protein [Halomonas denitrificans]